MTACRRQPACCLTFTSGEFLRHLVTMEVHSEVVRCAGLGLADPLDLWSTEGIQLPAALALLLLADLGGLGSAEGRTHPPVPVGSRSCGGCRGSGPAGCADTQLPLMPPELFGMGVAARHHRGGLGHARIGLPQPNAVSSRQAVEAIDGRMQQLGIDRDGDGLRLHRGVDREPLEVLAA